MGVTRSQGSQILRTDVWEEGARRQREEKQKEHGISGEMDVSPCSGLPNQQLSFKNLL